MQGKEIPAHQRLISCCNLLIGYGAQDGSSDYLAEKRSSATGQYPAAVILGCVDSRVPAEIVFDVGIGDTFNGRVAGNVLGRRWSSVVRFAVADLLRTKRSFQSFAILLSGRSVLNNISICMWVGKIL
jgi:hypothetical protein